MSEKQDDKDMLAPEKPQNKNIGARNLTILGIIAVLIALFSTSISLFIYHETGDIYIDRSRPGFISGNDDEDDEKDEVVINNFSQDGPITAEVLEEYLKNFDQKVESAINKNSDAFSENAFSDAVLNLLPSDPDSE